MPAPAAAAIAIGALRNPRRTRSVLLIVLTLIGLWWFLLIGVLGALFGLQPLQGGYEPSRAATAQIPPAYLELYQQAGQRYGIDPWVLAAIGRIETNHGRSTAPGVRSGVNTYSCCAGPMQFSVVGSPSTWDSYGVDGNHDGHTSPYDPEDADPRGRPLSPRRRCAGGLPARDLRPQPRRPVRRRRPRPGRHLPRRRHRPRHQ